MHLIMLTNGLISVHLETIQYTELDAKKGYLANQNFLFPNTSLEVVFPTWCLLNCRYDQGVLVCNQLEKHKYCWIF